MTIPSLEQVLTATGLDPAEHAILTGLLRQRETEIRDRIMNYAMQFGLHAEIVAEVFANGGLDLGEPYSDEVRQMIHERYHAHIEELRRQQGGM